MKVPLKVAAWSGVLSIALNLLLILIYLLSGPENIPTSISIFSGVANMVFSVLFYKGYFVLGKKFNNVMLIVLTWIGIVLVILGFLFSLIFGALSSVGAATAAEINSDDFGGQDLGMNENTALNIFLVFIIIWFLIAIPLGAYTILFGVAIMRMQKNMKYARTAGIWNMVSGATYIIFIGVLIKVVAYIFEIMMFFEASKKFERKRKI